MAMSSFAFAMLGIDSRPRSAQAQDPATPTPGRLEAVATTRTSRTSRKVTSHHNAFQTSCTASNDQPPTYATAVRHRPTARHVRNEILPAYSCTVNADSKMLLRLESINPLHESTESDWKEVHVRLRGTLLSFHRVKDGGIGKLLRSYTLQQAEVGLATDSAHSVLVPQCKIAHLIPAAARSRAWRKDPELFSSQRQTILRLRVETDQLLLAHAVEEQVHSLIHAIAAGIDIAPGIDERSVPKQCTVPRRRRRNRHQPSENLDDPALLAEQERIFRDMYPSLAGPSRSAESDVRCDRSRENELEIRPIATREEDELDLSVIQEDIPIVSTIASRSSHSETHIRPSAARQTTASTMGSAFNDEMIYATSETNFSPAGKWQPPHHRSTSQIQRYIRRCMPILLADAPRASDVLVLDGRWVKIDWRNELFEEWSLLPPSYRSHGFQKAKADLTRTSSQSSGSTSTNETIAPSVTSRAGFDEIMPADMVSPNLDLSKFQTTATHKSAANVSSSSDQARKTRMSRQLDANVHGVVFCF